MSSHLKNTTVTNFKPGLQTSDHMPRKRKRHYNKMSLMLLIFGGCCLTLILNSLHVQAKENNNTTSKGESMLSTDHQNHQHEAGNTNINADETNDNGTFKRLQQPSDIHSEINEPEGDEEEEELMLEEDEHSTEVIEMIQPPHTLRHQEHYKQRMLQHEKHKQLKQQQQHLNKNSNDGNDSDDGVVDVEEQQQELSQYNRNLRYKQIQQALREPIAFPTPHHRRHEQHLAKQRLGKQTEFSWPQQHHLRHQHHQHIQEFQPQLRHLKHEMRKQNATATKTKPQLHQRYFDRESSVMNPITNMMTTEGPHLRHTGSNLNWKSITYENNPHNRLFSDDSNSNEKEADVKRFSLSLHALENEKANKGKETLQEHTGIDGSDGDIANYDIGDTGDNNNDDYSYEDDDDVKEISKQNNYPSISSNTKTNVKRYTNPLKPPFSSSPYAFRKPHAGHYLKHASPQNMDVIKNNSNKDDNNNDDGDDDDYDDIENNKDEIDSSSDESSDDDNSDDKISDEKWNKIEHEHYRKQLQHQRAMQALRFRRTQNDNTPHTAKATATTTTITSNKYSLYSPSSISASSTYNAGWTKRQTMNDVSISYIYIYLVPLVSVPCCE